MTVLTDPVSSKAYTSVGQGHQCPQDPQSIPVSSKAISVLKIPKAYQCPPRPSVSSRSPKHTSVLQGHQCPQDPQSIPVSSKAISVLKIPKAYQCPPRPSVSSRSPKYTSVGRGHQCPQDPKSIPQCRPNLLGSSVSLCFPRSLVSAQVPKVHQHPQIPRAMENSCKSLERSIRGHLFGIDIEQVTEIIFRKLLKVLEN